MDENVIDKSRFEEAYAGKAPWNIGKPQPVFVQAADQITGSILDAGSGTGENALFFAERGHKATGIDYLEHPTTAHQSLSCSAFSGAQKFGSVWLLMIPSSSASTSCYPALRSGAAPLHTSTILPVTPPSPSSS